MRSAKIPEFEGYKEFLKPSKLLNYLKFGLIKTVKDKEYDVSLEEGREYALLLLSGYIKISAFEKAYIMGPRIDVFSGKAYALYITGDVKEVKVNSIYSSEIAVVSAPSSKSNLVKLVTPDDVRVRIVGQGNWRRHVHDVIYENVEAERLLVGETFNLPGNWSSYPPHRHDNDNIPYESSMEEIYYFKVKPKQGFGAQFIYTDDGSVDEIIKIQDSLAVIIDKGYHPVVAAPGYQIYYLWVLAGEKRVLIPFDDPNHGWVKNVEPILENWQTL